MLKENIYLSLIKEIDEIIDNVNPCGIYFTTDGVKCVGTFGVPCCHQACPMLTLSGCKTKNIGCKIFFCSEAIKELKKNEQKFLRWIELCGIVGKLHIKEHKYVECSDVIDKMSDIGISKLKHQKDILNSIDIK